MSYSNRIKLVIADDHALVTAGIVAQLESAENIEICDAVQDGDAAIKACLRYEPHIILLDIGLPGINGIEAAQAIHRAIPNTKIITMTGTERHHEIVQMIEVGSVACVYKSMEADLLNTIYAVMQGYVLLPDFVFDAYRKQTSPVEYQTTEKQKTIHEFTDQEQVILQELVQGYTNKEIAVHLGIKVSTVKAHMGNIFRKLNVQTRTEVVSIVTMGNLINLEED